MDEGRYTKKHYKISEVAEIIGVPPSTLRYWEKEFPELNPARTAHNQRLYSQADMHLVEIIHFLLHTQGLKVEAAKESIRTNRKNLSRKMDVIAKLHQIRSELVQLSTALNLRQQKEGSTD